MAGEITLSIGNGRIWKNNIPRILFIIVAISLIFFIGCSEDDTITIPLKKGQVHTFTGKYVSRGGTGRSITLPAQEHRLIVERTFEFNGEKRYLVNFSRGDDRLMGMILTQQDDGTYVIFGRNHKVLLFPKNVKSGQSWEVKQGSRKVKIRIGGRKTFKTGLGSLEGREISFTTKERARIKLWINDKYGIIAIHYSYFAHGSNRTEADLVIQKETNLDDIKKEEGKTGEGDSK